MRPALLRKYTESPTVEKIAIDRMENRNSTASCRHGGTSSRILRARSAPFRATHRTSHTATANTT
jgi:hypothetical protein